MNNQDGDWVDVLPTSDWQDITPNPIETETKEKGSIWSDIAQDFNSQSNVRKGLGVIKSLGTPFQMIEGGIANPSLEMQRGNFNLIDLAKESALGFRGMKPGQYGDVYRGAGFPEPIAATAGFILNVSPIKALSMANKAFGSVSKFSDKGIRSAGNNLIQATDRASSFVGQKLENAYKPFEQIKVDPDMFLEEMSKLPKPLIEKLETSFGNLDELAPNINVGVLRKLKTSIGKYRPSSFGKGERGVQETLDSESINDVYSAVKSLMTNSIAKSAGKKAAKLILWADDNFSNVIRASNFIKKTITDSTLMKPTKAGSMAKKLDIAGDVSGRDALNTIKGSGNEARKSINKAIEALEKFNRIQSLSKMGKHLVASAVYGGAIGSVGGMAASKFLNRGD